MNLILFADTELARPLPRDDIRARHILDVLRRQVGDDFDVGLMDGPRGKAVLRAVRDTGLELDFHWGGPTPELDPITLIVGLGRPQTQRKILQEAAAMGVQRMLFVRTHRGEPSYASSRLWTTGEYHRHVLTGVQQAFSTRIPQVRFGMELDAALAAVGPSTARLALDNYEGTIALARVSLREREPVALAVGSERGWSGGERAVLRRHDFVLTGMGERVLRTETAVVAGLALVKAARGAWA